MSLRRPYPHQLAPYHRDYVDRVPVGADIVAVLRAQVEEVATVFASRPGGFRYGPEKWSLAEVLGHLVDGEQLMATRLRRVSRGDTSPLPGFEQDLYVREGHFDAVPMASLIAEFRALREALVLQIQNMPETGWDHEGIVNGMEVVARMYPFLIAGHVDHHLQVVRERYLKGQK